MWDKKNKTVFSYPIKKTKLNTKSNVLGSFVVFCRCIYVKLLMPGGAE